MKLRKYRAVTNRIIYVQEHDTQGGKNDNKWGKQIEGPNKQRNEAVNKIHEAMQVNPGSKFLEEIVEMKETGTCGEGN
jgi:hypothetical protein